MADIWVRKARNEDSILIEMSTPEGNIQKVISFTEAWDLILEINKILNKYGYTHLYDPGRKEAPPPP